MYTYIFDLCSRVCNSVYLWCIYIYIYYSYNILYIYRKYMIQIHVNTDKSIENPPLHGLY